MVYAIIILLVFIIGFLLTIIFDKKYKHARISYKYTESSYSKIYYTYYFIVLYMSDGKPKSKTIKVTEDVYKTYNVDDKITI